MVISGNHAYLERYEVLMKNGPLAHVDERVVEGEEYDEIGAA